MAIPQDLDIQIQALLKDLSQKDRMAIQEALSLKYRTLMPTPCHPLPFSCHPRSTFSHPRESGGPGQPTKSCQRNGSETPNVSHGALVPRFRGDDEKWGGDDERWGGDDREVKRKLSLPSITAAPKALRSREEALLYLITRLPATYHGGAKVLEILKEVYPHSTEIKDILDLGAGVGSSRWLFSECLPNVQTCALMEQNPFMLEIGKTLSHPLGHFEPHSYVTQTFTPHDMAFLSYSLSELSLSQQTEVLQKLWPQTRHLLVLIEPGTPQGFQTIHRARTSLIQAGAHILAPCGHEAPCPMKDNNWCHFSVRLPRSMDHQRAKNASLSFEDEKFSYLIASKNPPAQALPPRIIQKPIKAKGHVILDICTPEGLERKTLTKSKTPDYKIKSRLEWGECL